MSDQQARPARRIWQVGELTALIRSLLEDSFPSVWVEGEISNFSRPSSGHWYFVLKDEQGRLNCAMFRGANRTVRFAPADGARVLVRGRITVYPPRGALQMVVEHMEPAGEGALRAAFEQLKARLAAEGLFDEAVKRPIPRLPHRIAIVSSPTGAALQDICTTLARRCPMIPVTLIPVPVQGADAAPAIAEALRRKVATTGADVVILARGGGSLEDLWAFNEEIVARAIRDCPVPVISGVGHETDLTIADLAADLRAATPTAAAASAVPDRHALSDHLRALQQRMLRATAQRIAEARGRHQALALRLRHRAPARRLELGMQRVDELSLRLHRASLRRLAQQRTQFQVLRRRLEQCAPRQRLAAGAARTDELTVRLQRATSRRITALKAECARQCARLSPAIVRRRIEHGRFRHEALSRRLAQAAAQRLQALNAALGPLSARLAAHDPRAVLARGYAMVLTADGRVLRDPATVADGDPLRLRLAAGTLGARVDRSVDVEPPQPALTRRDS